MFASIRFILFALIAAVCAQHFASEAQAPTGYNLQGPAMDAAYKSTVLRHMNAHRTNYTISKLVWNDGLTEIAQHRANLCRNLGLNVNALNRNSSQDFISYAYANHTYSGSQIGQLFSVDWYAAQWERWTRCHAGGNECGTYGCYEWSRMMDSEATSVGCYTYDCTNFAPVNSYATVCLWWTVFNTTDANANKIAIPANGTAAKSIDGTYGCNDKTNCVNDNAKRADGLFRRRF